MREGTTSRVMTADRPYGEFYYFYSLSPEYFDFTLVYILQSVEWLGFVGLTNGASNTGRAKIFFSDQKRPDRLWDASSLLFNGDRQLCLQK
jgi:hypothetical protein